MTSLVRPKVDLYDIECYSFCDKAPHKPMRDISVNARMTRLKRRVEASGCARSVAGVMMVHTHRHPHVLVLHTPSTNQYRLPGGKCHELEDDAQCLHRKIRTFLGTESAMGLGATATTTTTSAPDATTATGASGGEGAAPTEGAVETDGFVVGDLVGEWVRPNLEPLMYPYTPPHVTKPTEVRRVYVVHVPPSFTFSVPKNMKLLAVPLFELYDNSRFGSAILASLPQSLSRYMMNYC